MRMVRSLLTAALVFTPLALAQLDPVQALHSAPTTSDSLGVSIDVDRDTMIVGAYNYDPAGKTNAGAAVVFRWAGSSWTEEARLIASDGVGNDKFGRAVAIQGNTAVVGAYQVSPPGKSGAGAVYVFQRTGTTWTQVAKLVAPDAASPDNFGATVDLDGNTILIGAPFKTGPAGVQQGAAYVFTRTNGLWTQQAKLLDPTGASSDWFGTSVVLQGDTAVIGAPADDVGVSDRGTAHVFTRTAGVWTRKAILNPSDGGASDFFGQQVAISNGTIAVGSPQHDLTPNGNQGAIYVFTGAGTTWTQQQKLTRTGALISDFFPTSLAIEGDTIVAGFQGFDGIVGANQGAGLFFTRTAGVWSSSEFFQPIETQAGALFGASVGISDQFVVAGSFSYTRPGFTGAGAAYAFRRISGVPSRSLTITPPTPQANANFGNRMASDGTRLVVGAYVEDGSVGADEGAVYIYRVQDESLILEQRIFANDSFPGKKFGYSLAIDGTTLLVGAVEDAGTGSGIGSAYVFTFNGSTWSQQAKLVASDGTTLDRFGYSVAISGDRALIGAPYEDVPTASFGIQPEAGAAYFFSRSGTAWSQTAKVTDTSPTFGDNFGTAVALDGDVAYVGSPYYDVSTSVNQNRGAIFFYKWNGSAWAYDVAKSVAGGTDGEQFGTVVSGRAGLFGAVSPGTNTVYFFEWNGTSVVPRGSAASGESTFGSSLTVQSDAIVVGMPGYGGGGSAVRYGRSGSTIAAGVYFFPAVVDASDNLGEAVGYAGGAVFAGGGGITLAGSNNCGGVRRLQSGSRYDPFPINNSTGTRYTSIASALSAATVNQSLTSELGPLARTGGFSFGSSQARLNVPVDPFMASSHTITLTQGTELSTSSSSMRLWNHLDVPPGTSAKITAGQLQMDLPSSLFIGAGGALSITAPNIYFDGSTIVHPGGTLFVPSMSQSGSFSLFGGTISATVLNNIGGAQFSGYGDIAATVGNSGDFDVDANMQIVGNLTNSTIGRITVFNGTLTILGTLTNSGTIIGSVASRSALSAANDPAGLYAPPFEDRATQTIFATGGMTMDAASTLAPGAAAIVRTAGSFDCAINLNTRYAMNQSTLQLNGRGSFTLEAMSTDRGQAISALNPALPGSFPIGTLRIGPGNPSSPTIITIIDTRDNDTLGQSSCEAIYAENLIIESGAVLNAPACRVYYKSLTNHGTIATPSTVLRLYGPCPADLNNDGQVDDADFSIFIVQYNILDCADSTMPAGCSADLNSDFIVEDADFSIFVVAYNELLCP